MRITTHIVAIDEDDDTTTITDSKRKIILQKINQYVSFNSRTLFKGNGCHIFGINKNTSIVIRCYIRDVLNRLIINNNLEGYTNYDLSMIDSQHYSGISTIYGKINKMDIIRIASSIVRVIHHDRYSLLNYGGHEVIYIKMDN